jgi:hypothetical protein
MFNIKITDEDGKILNNVDCERYLLVAEDEKSQFTRAFSHNNYVDQFGLLELAQKQVLVELLKKRN